MGKKNTPTTNIYTHTHTHTYTHNIQNKTHVQHTRYNTTHTNIHTTAYPMRELVEVMNESHEIWCSLLVLGPILVEKLIRENGAQQMKVDDTGGLPDFSVQLGKVCIYKEEKTTTTTTHTHTQEVHNQ
jgi:hypothetical protein